MRFSTFFILAMVGMAAVVSGLNCYATMPLGEHRMHYAEYRRVSPPDPVGIERDSGWAERSTPHQNVHYSFPQIGVSDDVNNDGSTDFDWPRFAMALVLLTGGTLVCRRIFRSAAGIRQPTLRLQRPAKELTRLCPRADCGRMNPPMAKFCRRCGTALSDV